MSKISSISQTRRNILNFLGLSPLLALTGSITTPAAARARELQFSDFDWLWSYDKDRMDLTPEAVLGSKKEFESWRKTAVKAFHVKLDEVPIPVLKAEKVSTRDQSAYSIAEYSCELDSDRNLGSLLATPSNFDEQKPLVIVLHGHEVKSRGTPPWELFENNLWPDKLVRSGYQVWAPSHLWYKSLNDLYAADAHHIVWAKVIMRMMQAMRPHISGADDRGTVIAGHSSGALTSTVVMAADPRINAGIFSGHFVALDFFRENYRINKHPNQWDIPWLNSYTFLYALLAPRNVQFQMGRQDSFFPSVVQAQKSNSFFPGLPRAPMADEMLGEYLILREIWRKFGKDISLYLHGGGHEFQLEEAIRFLRSHS